MFRRMIAGILCVFLMFCAIALADGFFPKQVASTSYSMTQWLSNDNSRALLVCMAAADYCEAEGINYRNVASLLVSGKTYVRESEGLTVYIPDGDSCIRIRIRFNGAAEAAKADSCGINEIKSGCYTVTPEACREILAG